MLLTGKPVEAVPDTARADTSSKKRVVGDSVVFTKEEISNCCGKDAAMVLKAVNDTLRLIPEREDADEEVALCDCNCLFEKRLAVRKAVF